MLNHKLTPGQQKVLRLIVVLYFQEKKRHSESWEGLSWGIVKLGRRFKIDTLNILEREGYVKTEWQSADYEQPRRGAYGRWVGGFKRRVSTEIKIAPTEKGVEKVRELIAQQKAVSS